MYAIQNIELKLHINKDQLDTIVYTSLLLKPIKPSSFRLFTAWTQSCAANSSLVVNCSLNLDQRVHKKSFTPVNPLKQCHRMIPMC